MRIFVHEFVTGGGFTGRPLPPGLLREADMMVRALLQDLEEISGVGLIVSRDQRLPELPGHSVMLPRPGEDARSLFERGVLAADAAWIIAPETGGVLQDLAERTRNAGRLLLGSPSEAVSVAASKRATIAVLEAAGIPAVPTFSDPATIPSLPGPWVVKPDDGAGAEGTVQVPDCVSARRYLETRADLIAEPWIAGEPQSLSLVCTSGRALLLSGNRQRIRIDQQRVMLTGVDVNAVSDRDGQLSLLAGRIAAAMPSLWGYVGVDLVQTDDGPVIVEINPRLTTSYCGLRRALGLNVAEVVLGLLQPEPWRRWRRPEPGLKVTIAINGGHDS